MAPLTVSFCYFERYFVVYSSVVGFYGNHSEIAEKFIKSCEEVGIPRVSDVNTWKGSLGVAKVRCHSSPICCQLISVCPPVQYVYLLAVLLN